MYHIALLHQELLRLCTYCLDNGVREKLFLIQALYTFIQVDAGCAVEPGQSARLDFRPNGTVRDSHGRPGMVGG